MAGNLLRFGTFELDVATGELWKSGTPLRLAPQPAKVLALLASNAGRLVTRDEIRGQIWSGDTFVDFEQGLNFCIRQIRAALEDDAKAPTYIETLPRRGYRFIAGVDQIPAAGNDRIVLAVLPFANLSGDASQEYFSDGLTEEMITQLGRLNPARLRITGRTSAMRYKATQKSVAEIGRELGVSYLLEGSVRRAGDQIRVTAQLLRVTDRAHCWTQSYDRRFDDILALQSDIARAIAREIDVQLTPGEATRLAGVGAVSAPAHENYLKGRYLWNKRTEDGFRKSLEHFSAAIGHQPRYAAAYDGICDCYVMLACRGVLPVRETFQRAKDAARQALAIDPALGEAHASLAHVRLHGWDWEGLDSDFRHALDLSPAHSIAYYWYAEYLMVMGRADEAIVMARTARDMDPLSAVVNASFGMILYLARRFGEAAECLQRAIEINPDHFLLHFRLGLVHLQRSSPSDALDEMQRAVDLSGGSTESRAGLAQACAGAGQVDAMQAIVDALTREERPRYVSPYNLSRVCAAAGDTDGAFAWLERAYDERNPDLIELRNEPVFDSMRADSRFGDLLRRVGWCS